MLLRFAGDSWNVTASEKVFVKVGDVSRTVYCGESNVLPNTATILRSVRITVHQDELLQSGCKTYSLTEEDS
jgi:hypothetical protein